MWIGGPGGLTRWQDGRLTRWTEDEGLPSSIVRAVHEDDDGVLWIGTYDSGLVRLENGRFTHYTTRVGLFNDGVFRILEDGRGNLWMSSNRGISRVRKQELNEFAAGRRREISSIALRQGRRHAQRRVQRRALARRHRGPRRHALVPDPGRRRGDRPRVVSINPRPPPVVIESFLLDREPVVPVPFDRPLRIAPGRGTFEIGYTSLGFNNPEHVRFKYRLTGLEDDWIDARTRRTAYYSHVPPGSYTFTVIAANSDGVWNTKGSSPADRGASALLSHLVVPDARGSGDGHCGRRHVEAAGSAVEAGARRPAGVHTPADRLAGSRAQAHRGGAARQPRSTAGRHQEPGGARQRRERRDADGCRGRVDEIATEAHQAIGEVREIAQNLRPHELDRLGLTKALAGLVRKASAASTIALKAEVDAMDGVFAKDEEVNVYRVVQESLNNVLKHSGATRASLTVRRSGSRVQITIEDNGRGFVPAGNGAGPARSDGFGLIGIAERVTLLGGRTDVHSAPGQGTTINVTFDRV